MDEPLIFKKAAAAETSNRAPSPRYININPSRQQTNYVFVNGDTLTSPSKTPNSPLANLLADLNKNKKTRLTGRSHSAPSVLTDTKEEFCDSLEPRRLLILWRAIDPTGIELDTKADASGTSNIF